MSAVFSFPQSVGFIGGHPNSAHYFIAGQGDVVYFLDPHTPQPRVPLDPASPDPLHASWHLGAHRRMVLHDLDPSITFGASSAPPACPSPRAAGRTACAGA